MLIFRLQCLIFNRRKILNQLKCLHILETLLIKCIIRKSSVLNLAFNQTLVIEAVCRVRIIGLLLVVLLVIEIDVYRNGVPY